MLPQAPDRTKKGFHPSGSHQPSPPERRPPEIKPTASRDIEVAMAPILELADIKAVMPSFFPAPQVLMPVPPTPVRNINENAAVIGQEFQDLTATHFPQHAGSAQDRDGTKGPKSIQSAIRAMSRRQHVTPSSA
jgi:hypothetical protein